MYDIARHELAEMGVTDNTENEEEAERRKGADHVTYVTEITTANVEEPISDSVRDIKVNNIKENVIRTGNVVKKSKSTEH